MQATVTEFFVGLYCAEIAKPNKLLNFIFIVIHHHSTLKLLAT